MKHQTLFFSCLAIAALAVGCDKAETTTQQLDQVQQKTAEAAQDMQDYTFAQRTEFTEKMQTQLAEINQDLERLAAKIEASSDAAKAEAQPKLEALRAKSGKLGQLLEQAKDATESTWDSVKATSKEAYAELKDGFTQARQWVSEKIAP